MSTRTVTCLWTGETVHMDAVQYADHCNGDNSMFSEESQKVMAEKAALLRRLGIGVNTDGPDDAELIARGYDPKVLKRNKEDFSTDCERRAFIPRNQW